MPRRQRSILLLGSVLLLAAPAAAMAQEPEGRGLLGGVTSTLDGALVTVSDATGGAVSVPTTGEVTSAVSGTLEVVGGTVEQVAAPVTSGPQVTLAVPGLARVGGAAVLDLVVGNAGSAACAPLVDLAVTGADGVKLAGGVTELTSIAPGASGEYVLPWPAGLDSGTYAVTTTATACGTPQTVALTVRLDADAATGGSGGDGGAGGGSGGGGNAGGGSSGGGAGAGASGGSGGGATGTANGGGSSAGNNVGDGGTKQAAAGGGGAASGGSQVPGTVGATRDPGRVTTQAGRGEAAGFGTTAARGGSMLGPPAPAALTARSGVDRVAGAQGSAATSGELAGPTRQLPTSVGAAVKAIPAVLERAAPALAVLGLIGAMFLLQEGLARRDPKLALAPVGGPDDDLDFVEPGAFLERLTRKPT